MAKNKNQQRKATSPAVSVTEKIPLVSVIIPMYNAAKFIPATLESLLYQTMQDFEVVIIDDCSTDNSVEVVESFAPHFGGRLHVVKLPENTGTPGLPRNVGIQLARGKYIAFLDSDDLFTPTALQELTTLAEKYQADVVQLFRWLVLRHEMKNIDAPEMINFAELINTKAFTVRTFLNLPNETTLESKNIGERVTKWLNFSANGFWSTLLFFYRRDFLITNQITFPKMFACEDLPFAFESLCKAKNYLIAPNIVNIIRKRTGSASWEDHQYGSDPKYFTKKIHNLNQGFRVLERMMDKIPFFNNNLSYRYYLLSWFVNHRISLIFKFYINNPPFILNEFVKKEFHGEDASLAAYMLNTVNIQRLQLMQLQAENIALKKSLAQR